LKFFLDVDKAKIALLLTTFKNKKNTAQKPPC